MFSSSQGLCLGYSIKERTCWCVSVIRMRVALTDYSTMEEILNAVEELPYEGGSSRTGVALEFLVESVFSPSIVRENTPKV